ncbi:MAG: CpsB/CapC family capsule biosynthesis tyrosine phosphatase [Phycisphaerae bacterium]
MRIDTHHHLIPSIDDGCRNLDDVVENLRLMALAGYTRVFCTPHCLHPEFPPLPNSKIVEEVNRLRRHLADLQIPTEIQAGGELRLDANLYEKLRATGIPTFGMAGTHVLVETWEQVWPEWVLAEIEWLQEQGLTVVLAHPERLPPIQNDPKLVDQLIRMGVLFQGTLGPIGGEEKQRSAELAAQFLKEGRYFMVASDGHRPETLGRRLAGLETIRELVGEAGLRELTVTNPGKIWAAGLNAKC